MSRESPPPLEGTALLELRRQARWTQRRLEREAGLSRGTLSLYESGKRKIARPLLNRLARTLGHPVEAVDRAIAGLAQIPAPEPSGAETPASLCPNERLVIEAAAGQAAQRAAETVRAGLGLRLVQDRLRRERRTAGKLWEQLSRLPTFAARRARVASDPVFRRWALCERLCDESDRAAAHDAGEARELAELALQVAELTPGSDPWRCRLQGYALAFVGNSLRVGGDLLSADSAFHRSSEFWEAGDAAAPAPLDGSLVLDLKASLRRQQGREDEALTLLRDALEAALTTKRQCDILFARSLVFTRMERFEDALADLQLVRSLISETENDRQRWLLECNYALNLSHLGRFKEAEQRLGEIQMLTLDIGQDLARLRLRWLESRIAAGLGKEEESAEALTEVWKGFADRGITFDAAVATLELAALELDRGHTAKVKTLAGLAAEVFVAQVIPRELFTSVRLFWEAAKREAATATSARRLFLDLQRFGQLRDTL